MQRNPIVSPINEYLNVNFFPFKRAIRFITELEKNCEQGNAAIRNPKSINLVVKV